MIKAAVFDIGGVIEIVDDDAWPDAWAARWGRFSTLTDSNRDAAMVEFWDAYCGELNVELSDFARTLRPSLVVAALSNSAPGARAEEEGTRQTAVDGARAAGWHALLHERTGASIEAIRRLL